MLSAGYHLVVRFRHRYTVIQIFRIWEKRVYLLYQNQNQKKKLNKNLSSSFLYASRLYIIICQYSLQRGVLQFRTDYLLEPKAIKTITHIRNTNTVKYIHILDIYMNRKIHDTVFSFLGKSIRISFC